MKEYIEREAAKTEIATYFDILIYEKPEGIEPNLNNIKFALLDLIDDNTVAADVVPVKHGEWVPIEQYIDSFKVNIIHHYECSNCKTLEYTNNKNYCPDCGTKMDGGNK